MKIINVALLLSLCGTTIVGATELEKSEVERIAKQYVDALEKGDFKTIESLFHDYDSKWSRSGYNWYSRMLKDVSIGDTDKNSICIIGNAGSKETFGASGWLQFTSTGKIKYCKFLAPHPIDEATYRLRALSRGKNDPPNEFWISRIKERGIPTFGIRADMTRSEMRVPIEKIRDWILENGSTFDNTEPKLFLPEKRMRIIERELKSI